MANLKKKKAILKVVNNQLRDNDPPCTKEVYEKLLDWGYFPDEAKDKIGAVVLEEIYELVKEGKPFDVEKYKNSLEEMLQECRDFEDTYHIDTEWDEWEELVLSGYGCLDAQNQEEALEFWQDAWKILCGIVEGLPEKEMIYDLMIDMDFMYPVDDWLEDYEQELDHAERYEERIALCQKVLEIFEWEEYDGAGFRCGIGESLFESGKIGEAYAYYEKWLGQEPDNAYGLSGFSWVLNKNGESGRAYELVRNASWGVSCDRNNYPLFACAVQLAKQNGKEEESQWYQQQLDGFTELVKNQMQERDHYLNELLAPKQPTIVKEKKTYPNDPCPCGSGKKYKKCCGKS